MPLTSRNDTVSVQTTQPNSLETIAGNVDLLNEILLRLPVKALIKFKSVSKHWLSLISDPKFCQLYNSNPNPNPRSVSGLFLKRYSGPEFEYINLEKTSKSNPCRGPFRSLIADDLNIVHSCNGLMLCSTNKAPSEYYVYNPTLNQHTILPLTSPLSKSVRMEELSLNLAFDPKKSPHYKVVVVRRDSGAGIRNQPYHIELYSSETRRWRLWGRFFRVNSELIRFDGGVFWKGSVHWISPWRVSLYFNVEEEKLSTMPMPPVPQGRYNMGEFRYFGESRGHLHLIDHESNLQTPHFNVYEMGMDYSGWIVKFRVDFSQFPGKSIQQCMHRSKDLDENENFFSLLCVVRGEVDEDSYLVLQRESEVIRYNFKSRTFSKICDFEVGTLQIGSSMFIPYLSRWSNVYQFIESFAFV